MSKHWFILSNVQSQLLTCQVIILTKWPDIRLGGEHGLLHNELWSSPFNRHYCPWWFARTRIESKGVVSHFHNIHFSNQTVASSLYKHGNRAMMYQLGFHTITHSLVELQQIKCSFHITSQCGSNICHICGCIVHQIKFPSSKKRKGEGGEEFSLLKTSKTSSN